MAKVDTAVQSTVNQSIGSKQEAKKFLDTIDASKIKQARRQAGRALAAPGDQQRSDDIFDKALHKAERANALLSDDDKSNDQAGIDLAQRSAELLIQGLQDAVNGPNAEAAAQVEAQGAEIAQLLNLPAGTLTRTVAAAQATPVVTPVTTDPAIASNTPQNGAIVTPSTVNAADVLNEWTALKTSFNKLSDIADKAKITNAGTLSLGDQINYVLNTSREGLSQGRVQEANGLIDTLRGLVSVYGADIGARANRKDLAALSDRAENITARLATQDIVASTPLDDQQFQQTMETIAPQSGTEKLQDRIIALQNDATDAVHRSLNTGADISVTDKKLNNLIERSQIALDEGRLTRSQKLLNKAKALFGKADKQSKQGEGAPLTLDQVTQAYNEVQQLPWDDEGKSSAFASKLFSLVHTGNKNDGADDGQSDIASLMQSLGENEGSSITDDIIRLYANKTGYSYTTGTSRLERVREIKPSGESLDDLYAKAVKILGGDRAMDGHRFLVRNDDKGRVKGTMFNDAVIVESGQQKDLSISTGAGDDTVFSSDVSLRNAAISTGGGKDTVALNGDLRNVRISTGHSNDQIQIAGASRNLDIDAGDNSDKIIVSGLTSDSTIAGGYGHDMMLLAGETTNTTVLAGEGDDGIGLEGKFKKTTVDVSEDKREHGLDTVQVGESFRGAVNVVDTRHSRINYDYTYLKHEDTVLLGGMGWTANGESDRYTRRDDAGKTLGQIILGSGRGGGDDAEIEKVFGNGEQAFRDIDPHVNSKPFGVTAGEWATTIAEIALSTVNPGFAAVIAMKNFMMSASRNDGLGMAISALSFVGAGASSALGGAGKIGSSTYGMSPGTANTLKTVVEVANHAKGGLGVVQSVTDGDVTLSDVISGAQFAVSLTNDANTAKYNQILDYVRIAASTFETGKFDPTAVLTFGAGLAGGQIGGAIESDQRQQNTQTIDPNQGEITYGWSEPGVLNELFDDPNPNAGDPQYSFTNSETTRSVNAELFGNNSAGDITYGWSEPGALNELFDDTDPDASTISDGSKRRFLKSDTGALDGLANGSLLSDTNDGINATLFGNGNNSADQDASAIGKGSKRRFFASDNAVADDTNGNAAFGKTVDFSGNGGVDWSDPAQNQTLATVIANLEAQGYTVDDPAGLLGIARVEDGKGRFILVNANSPDHRDDRVSALAAHAQNQTEGVVGQEYYGSGMNAELNGDRNGVELRSIVPGSDEEAAAYAAYEEERQARLRVEESQRQADIDYSNAMELTSAFNNINSNDPDAARIANDLNNAYAILKSQLNNPNLTQNQYDNIRRDLSQVERAWEDSSYLREGTYANTLARSIGASIFNGDRESLNNWLAEANSRNVPLPSWLSNTANNVLDGKISIPEQGIELPGQDSDFWSQLNLGANHAGSNISITLGRIFGLDDVAFRSEDFLQTSEFVRNYNPRSTGGQIGEGLVDGTLDFVVYGGAFGAAARIPRIAAFLKHPLTITAGVTETGIDVGNSVATGNIYGLTRTITGESLDFGGEGVDWALRRFSSMGDAPVAENETDLNVAPDLTVNDLTIINPSSNGVSNPNVGDIFETPEGLRIVEGIIPSSDGNAPVIITRPFGETGARPSLELNGSDSAEFPLNAGQNSGYGDTFTVVPTDTSFTPNVNLSLDPNWDRNYGGNAAPSDHTRLTNNFAATDIPIFDAANLPSNAEDPYAATPGRSLFGWTANTLDFNGSRTIEVIDPNSGLITDSFIINPSGQSQSPITLRPSEPLTLLLAGDNVGMNIGPGGDSGVDAGDTINPNADPGNAAPGDTVDTGGDGNIIPPGGGSTPPATPGDGDADFEDRSFDFPRDYDLADAINLQNALGQDLAYSPDGRQYIGTGLPDANTITDLIIYGARIATRNYFPGTVDSDTSVSQTIQMLNDTIDTGTDFDLHDIHNIFINSSHNAERDPFTLALDMLPGGVEATNTLESIRDIDEFFSEYAIYSAIESGYAQAAIGDIRQDLLSPLSNPLMANLAKNIRDNPQDLDWLRQGIDTASAQSILTGTDQQFSELFTAIDATENATDQNRAGAVRELIGKIDRLSLESFLDEVSSVPENLNATRDGKIRQFQDYVTEGGMIRWSDDATEFSSLLNAVTSATTPETSRAAAAALADWMVNQVVTTTPEMIRENYVRGLALLDYFESKGIDPLNVQPDDVISFSEYVDLLNQNDAAGRYPTTAEVTDALDRHGVTYKAADDGIAGNGGIADGHLGDNDTSSAGAMFANDRPQAEFSRDEIDDAINLSRPDYATLEEARSYAQTQPDNQVFTYTDRSEDGEIQQYVFRGGVKTSEIRINPNQTPEQSAPENPYYLYDLNTSFATGYAGFANNYTQSNAAIDFLGADRATVYSRMRANRLTTAEALTELGYFQPDASSTDPSYANRFVTHPDAYPQAGGRYDAYTRSAAPIAQGLYEQGFSSQEVSTFLAEQRLQYEAIRGGNRIGDFNAAFAMPASNPTFFVNETNVYFAGNHPNYRQAAYDILQRIERDISSAEIFPFDPDTVTDDAAHLYFDLYVENIDQYHNWDLSLPVQSLLLGDASDLSARIGSQLFQGPYDTSMLNGMAIRVPNETAFGTGGAVYIFETKNADGQYNLEVMLDQGTALPASPGSNANGARDEITRRTFESLDTLLANADGTPTFDELRQFAGIWHDLSVTSANWVGGGAGINHIQMAAAWKRLTGTELPGLNAPADLAATMRFSRQEFIDHFVTGGLFRNGDQVLRNLGLNGSQNSQGGSVGAMAASDEPELGLTQQQIDGATDLGDDFGTLEDAQFYAETQPENRIFSYTDNSADGDGETYFFRGGQPAPLQPNLYNLGIPNTLWGGASTPFGGGYIVVPRKVYAPQGTGQPQTSPDTTATPMIAFLQTPVAATNVGPFRFTLSGAGTIAASGDAAGITGSATFGILGGRAGLWGSLFNNQTTIGNFTQGTQTGTRQTGTYSIGVGTLVSTSGKDLVTSAVTLFNPALGQTLSQALPDGGSVVLGTTWNGVAQVVDGRLVALTVNNVPLPLERMGLANFDVSALGTLQNAIGDAAYNWREGTNPLFPEADLTRPNTIDLTNRDFGGAMDVSPVQPGQDITQYDDVWAYLDGIGQDAESSYFWNDPARGFSPADREALTTAFNTVNQASGGTLDSASWYEGVFDSYFREDYPGTLGEFVSETGTVGAQQGNQGSNPNSEAERIYQSLSGSDPSDIARQINRMTAGQVRNLPSPVREALLHKLTDAIQTGTADDNIVQAQTALAASAQSDPRLQAQSPATPAPLGRQDIRNLANQIAGLTPEQRAQIASPLLAILTGSVRSPTLLISGESVPGVYNNVHTHDLAFSGSYDPSHPGADMDRAVQISVNGSKAQFVFPVTPHIFNMPSGDDLAALGVVPNAPAYYLARQSGPGGQSQTIMGKITINGDEVKVEGYGITDINGDLRIRPDTYTRAEFETLLQSRIPDQITEITFVSTPRDVSLGYMGPSVDRNSIDLVANQIATEFQIDPNFLPTQQSQYVGLVGGNPYDPAAYRTFYNAYNHANLRETELGIPLGSTPIAGAGEITLAKETVSSLTNMPNLGEADQSTLNAVSQFLAPMRYSGGITIIHADAGSPRTLQGLSYGLPNVNTMQAESNLSNIPNLIKLFQQNPDQQFIWAHSGASLTSTMPDTYFDEVQRVLDSAPNVKIDLSWAVTNRWIQGNEVIGAPQNLVDQRRIDGWAELVARNPDRFLWGSDNIGASQVAGADVANDVLQELQQNGFLRAVELAGIRNGNPGALDQFLRTNFDETIRPAQDRVSQWRSDPEVAAWLARGGPSTENGLVPPKQWIQTQNGSWLLVRTEELGAAGNRDTMIMPDSAQPVFGPSILWSVDPMSGQAVRSNGARNPFNMGPFNPERRRLWPDN